MLMLFLLYFTIFPRIGAIDLYSNRSEGQWIVDGRKSYLVLNNLRHEFPDCFSMMAYGFNCYNSMGHTEFSRLRSPVYPSNEEFSRMNISDPLISRWDNHDNKVMLALNTSYLILESHLLFKKTNAAALYRPQFKDWLISCRGERMLRVGTESVNLSTPLSEVAAWLMNALQSPSTQSKSFNYLEMKEEDLRFLGTADGRYFSVFNRHNHAGKLISVYNELYTNFTNTTAPTFACSDIVVAESGRDEKNWTPFDFRSQLYFLVSIWPFHVVRLNISEHNPQVGTPVLHTFEELDFRTCFLFPWSERERGLVLRGGTQAVHIGNHTYLGISHSVTNITDANSGALRTYSIGAFTFTAHDHHNEESGIKAKFKLTGISRVPIADNSWYRGPWMYNPRQFGFIDYVIFPMSIMIDKDNVFLVYGKQDSQTWISRLSLRAVLDSLLTVDNTGHCNQAMK